MSEIVLSTEGRGVAGILVLLLILLAGPADAQGPELPRRAYLGADFTPPSPERAGALVRSVTAGTAAEEIGLREDDRVLRMNGTLLDGPSTFARERQRLRGGDTLRLTILRDGETLEREAVLPPLPRESLAGVETEYGSVLSPRGYRVQTIVTKPEDAGGPLPGIFFVRWMSCSPVERPVGPRIGIDLFLRELATRSGAVMMRVEKPGLGDSEGPPCRDVDFRSELDAHRAAFRAFRRRPDVDPERVVVVAQSNGAAYAPLVVEEAEVAGFAVTGGWVKSWFEHMMEIERRRFDLMGLAPGEVNRRMAKVAAFYTEFLVRGRMPGDILRERPHLAEIWAWGDRHQYGLPAAYLQQLQALNLEEVWSQVDVPTLVFWGEYDWAMSREDHVRIAELVNRNGAGLARFVEVPRMHHSLYFFDSLQQGFDDFSSGTWDPGVVGLVLEWLEEVTSRDGVGPHSTR